MGPWENWRGWAFVHTAFVSSTERELSSGQTVGHGDSSLAANSTQEKTEERTASKQYDTSLLGWRAYISWEWGECRRFFSLILWVYHIKQPPGGLSWEVHSSSCAWGFFSPRSASVDFTFTTGKRVGKSLLVGREDHMLHTLPTPLPFSLHMFQARDGPTGCVVCIHMEI